MSLDRSEVLNALDFPTFYQDELPTLEHKGDGQVLTKCPFHEDGQASLSINLAEGVYFCHAAGCGESGGVFDFYMKRHSVDFKEALQKVAASQGIAHLPKSKSKKREVATYDYQDENGELLYQVVRYEPKTFRQRRPDGNGGWINNLKGVRRVPYRLPGLTKAERAVIVEGEKDADRLQELGITATTNPMGAGAWKPEYNEHFKNKRVVLIPDNHKEGMDHMQEVARNLQPVAAVVKIAQLPGVPDKGDVTDYLDNGGTKESLAEILQQAPEFEHAARVEVVEPREEPLPLRRQIAAPDPYPTEAFTPPLREMVLKTTEIVNCPVAMVAQSVLASAALTVQGHVDIEIDGRKSPTSENFLTVAESGERKSEVDRIASAPHDKRQRDLAERESLTWNNYDAEHAAWKKTREEILNSKKYAGKESKRVALVDLGPEPDSPLDSTITTEEPTYEGLIKLLATGQPSVGLFSDEGGRFVGGYAMTAENQLKTVAGLSKLWDGDKITRSRAKEGTINLYGRRVSMHLMIQPVVSSQLFSSTILTEQGFLSRCLVAFPESTIGQRPYREQSIYRTSEFKSYFSTLINILEADLPIKAGTRNELEPRAITLTPDAKRVWIAFHDHIEQLMKDDEDLSPIRGFASKAPEHAARLAGIMSVVNDFEVQQIPRQQIEAGITLIQFYIDEALRLFHSRADDPELVLAEKCLEWIRERGGTIALPDLYQAGPYGMRDKKSAEPVVEILVDHGWLTKVEGGATVRGKRRRDVWRVVE